MRLNSQCPSSKAISTILTFMIKQASLMIRFLIDYNAMFLLNMIIIISELFCSLCLSQK